MSSSITWMYDGMFCSGRFVRASKKDRECQACSAPLPRGTSSWRIWSAGASFTICELCWDHAETCDECREEYATWEGVARCRLENEREI